MADELVVGHCWEALAAERHSVGSIQAFVHQRNARIRQLDLGPTAKEHGH